MCVYDLCLSSICRGKVLAILQAKSEDKKVAIRFSADELSGARDDAAYDYKQIVEDPIAIAGLLTERWLRDQHEFNDLVDSDDHPSDFLGQIQRDAAICAYATKILAEGLVYRLTLADRRLRNLQMLVGINLAFAVAICWKLLI